MSQPSAAFVAQAHEAGGASFYHRYNSMANWEPYTAAQNMMILDAMTRSPDSGSMPLQLGTAQFEIRWGSEAKSRNMSRAEFGILQVTLGKTRSSLLIFLRKRNSSRSLPYSGIRSLRLFLFENSSPSYR